jgi:heme exporter protein B
VNGQTRVEEVDKALGVTLAPPRRAPIRRGRPPGLVGSALAVLAKDLLIEWRSRARLNALIFFSLSTLLIFSFALGAESSLGQKNAAGYLWLAVLLSSVLSLGESFRVETENAALEGLLTAPMDARALFLGKALGNWVLLFALGVLLLPVMVALFDLNVKLGMLKLVGVLALGCSAISAPGTVHSAIANHSRARDVLLPLLLFPMLIPALLAAVRASALVLQGDPMNQLGSWLKLLGVFNVLYWALGFVLFPRVVED